MIIKIIGVKNTKGALSRILKYIATDKGRITDYKKQGIFYNLFQTDLQGMEQEFAKNYEEYALKRSNGNISYHVILSLSPIDREKASISMMDDLVQRYLEHTFPDALAFATHHKSEAHWHSHIALGANNIKSKKGTRLSLAELKESHAYMLEYIRDQYPQLEIGIDMDNWGKKLHSEKAYYKQKRNPDIQLTKDELSEKVQALFRGSANTKDFYQQLKQAGFETYNYKQELKGIFWNDENGQSKKMRFSRLGIKDEMRHELDKQNERLKELENLREAQADREKDKSNENEDTHESDKEPEQDIDV